MSLRYKRFIEAPITYLICQSQIKSDIGFLSRLDNSVQYLYGCKLVINCMQGDIIMLKL